MDGLYFLVPTLLVVFVSFLIVRAAAIALMMTGMDRKRAVFQALSAFTGTGFTTKEAEFIGNSLSESGLSEKGLMVLGIERGKNWIPLPKANEMIQEGDRIVVYGPLEVSRDLFREE